MKRFLQFCLVVLAFAPVFLVAGCGRSEDPWYVTRARIEAQHPVPPALPAPSAGQPETAAFSNTGYRINVAKGETLYGVSRRTGAPVRALIEGNNLAPPYQLRAGQWLVIPAGQYHRVRGGDTLYSISRRYNVDMTSLASLNDVKPPYGIISGQLLRLPARARSVTRPDVLAAAPVTAPRQQPDALPGERAVKVTSPQPRPEGRQVSGKTLPNFIWPVRGNVLSSYGPKNNGQHNDGINIAAPEGSPVKAAADGVVVYAGNGLAGYGKMLLIRHPGGWVTAYAHNGALLVKRGDGVDQGQAIAQSGRTGNVTAPQVHFQLRRKGDAINPVRYLG